MSLSGTLEIFPLEEVLRLLARSRRDGCLRVEGAQEGRIYMESGSLTYASVEPDEALRDNLVASGVVTREGLQRLEASGGALSEALSPSSAGSALTDLVREQCVESLYRMRRPGTGRFEFLLDTRPPYPTAQAFDVEALISESDRRASEWADIEAVVPDLSTPWRMVPELDEDSVTLSDTAWRFLAALEGSCSVEGLAGRLGLTTFQTARRMAELSRARLVEPVRTPSAPPEPSVAPGQPSYGEPAREEATAVAPEGDRSWWLEREVVEEPAQTEEPPPPRPEAQPVAEAREEAEVKAEGDESFLETVFGELERTEDPETQETEEEQEGGFGLLRRRGLSAAFRDLTDG